MKTRNNLSYSDRTDLDIWLRANWHRVVDGRWSKERTADEFFDDHGIVVTACNLYAMAKQANLGRWPHVRVDRPATESVHPSVNARLAILEKRIEALESFARNARATLIPVSDLHEV